MTRVVVFSGDRGKCSGGERGTMSPPGNHEIVFEGRLFNGELWIFDKYAPLGAGVAIELDPACNGGWRWLGVRA